MNRTSLAAALIASFEGLRLTAYRDSGGVWTIGFGHTKDVTQGQTCTAEQAAAWLAEDAEPLFALVADQPMIAAAAYVSFGYNCGRTVLEAVLEGNADMDRYVHDRHGNLLQGLVARRVLEAALVAAATTSPTA